MSVPKIDLKLDGAEFIDERPVYQGRGVELSGERIANIWGETNLHEDANPDLADLRARAFVGLPRLLDVCRSILDGVDGGTSLDKGSLNHTELRDAYLAIAEPDKPAVPAVTAEDAELAIKTLTAFVKGGAA